MGLCPLSLPPLNRGRNRSFSSLFSRASFISPKRSGTPPGQRLSSLPPSSFRRCFLLQMLHIYHASIGEKEFQFSAEINRLSRETYEADVARLVEETSSTMLESLQGEDALCCACRKGAAVRLIHHTMLFDQVFPPRVEDLPQPVCASAECAAVSEARYMMDMEDVATAQGRESPNGCFACRAKKRKARGGVSSSGEGLLRCSRCKTAKYCSPECQRSDWSVHRQVCMS